MIQISQKAVLRHTRLCDTKKTKDAKKRIKHLFAQMTSLMTLLLRGESPPAGLQRRSSRSDRRRPGAPSGSMLNLLVLLVACS